MGKGRLEAFSDGVIAIIITIMVLEMKVPHGFIPRLGRTAVAGVRQLRPQLRHCRHLLEQPSPHAAFGNAGVGRSAVEQSTSAVLVVADAVYDRMDGREPFRAAAVALYGVDLLMCAIAYFILVRALIASHGADSEFAARVGTD